MEIELTKIQAKFIYEYFEAKRLKKPLPIWYGGSASGKNHVMKIISDLEKTHLKNKP